MKKRKKVPAAKIKKAPLYLVLGKIKRGKEVKVTVVPIMRAKKEVKSWIYPCCGEIVRVQKRTLGKVDGSDFKDASVTQKFYRGHCMKSGLDKMIRMVKSSKIPKVKIVTLTKKPSMPIKEKKVTEKVFSAKDQADIDAVKAVLAGNKEQFSVLYKRYYAIINYRYSSSLKFNKELADDLTADLFVKVYENLSSWTPNYTFNSWITRVAQNFLIDHTRKPKLNVVSIDAGVTSEQSKNDDAGSLVMNVEDVDNLSPEDAMIAEQKSTFIKESLDKLDDKSREILNMLYYKQMSYVEISEEINLPLNTVKAHIFRGKSKLREIIQSNKQVLTAVIN